MSESEARGPGAQPGVSDAERLAGLARGLAATLERLEQRGRRRTAAPHAPVALAAEPSAAAPRTRAAPSPAPPPPSSPAPTGVRQPGAGSGSDDEQARETERLAREAPDLATLKQTVASCRACTLCETRTQTVFADGREGGTQRARVMFIGEAPGQHEDEQGVPFVGRAGQLLTDIVQKGMGLDRSEVYIANVLKCRPPGNRDPERLEKARCTPFLDRQIQLVAPEVLIPLGLHASRHLLDSTDSMGRLRGRIHERRGVKVIPTYHPAFLLRSPSMKKECWKDIQLAMGVLGLSAPGSGAK